MHFSAGQIEVLIDDHWITEPCGNGRMFFDPRPDSGTLRLDVLTYIADPSVDPKAALNATASKYGALFDLLPSGFRLVTYDEPSVEDGIPIRMRFWHLAARRGTTLLYPIFSFTLDEAVADDPCNVADLAMVDHAIRTLRAHF
jgi:hypothetical protein